MNISDYIVENITENFEECASIRADIEDLNNRITDLEQQVYVKKAQMTSRLASLLCLCRTDHDVLNGRTNKIELIKLYRISQDSSLRDAKETVEQYIQPGELR